MRNHEAGTGAAHNDERAVRLQHIDALQKMGVDPYPAAAFNPSHSVSAVVQAAETLLGDEARLHIAGRVTGWRDMGKTIFLDLSDGDTRLQIYFAGDRMAARDWETLALIDVGDLIGVDGVLFRTRRGELSLDATMLTVLAKSLAPPPLGKRDASGRSHQALADTGRLLRERHIALQTDADFRRRIRQRDRIIREVRAYFHAEGFVELETPILSHAYGGAAATPFQTYSEALDAKLYLRVSPECQLKRALCGDLPKVFEIGKNFRNEGVDRDHNPEFSAVEWYEAWSDYREQMVRFETLVSRLAMAATSSGIVHFRGEPIDFTPPWPRLRIIDLVADELSVSSDAVTLSALEQYWDAKPHEGPRPGSWGEFVMAIFEDAVEGSIRGPAFIIDHPVEVSPLTKRHRSDSRLVERFEPFVLGLEIGNAYSELNDPREQRRRLEEQDIVRDERYGLDEPFLQALEHGMPQAGGAGLGLDRIIMILTDAKRLSDVLLFPAG
jgi:lysyl-tRNA synthetase class 2